jgi:cytosine permease
LICGLIGTVVGSFDAIFYFEEFLIWLCVIIAPFAGVMIADYWIIGKGKPENWAPTRNINWTGMVALLLGVVVSFTLTFGIIGINGPIVAMAAYLLLHKIMPKPERMAA